MPSARRSSCSPRSGSRRSVLFGAGQTDDCGDLVTRNGALVVQVRNWRDVGRACFDGADAAQRQALAHSTAALGVALVRRRGGRWTVTMTPDTLVWLLHAARVVIRQELTRTEARHGVPGFVNNGQND
jgi:hypothetical protein